MCGGPQVDVGSSSSQECATTISKEQFEQLINAVVPKARRTEMPNNMKQNMARQLGQLLVMVHAAEQRVGDIVEIDHMDVAGAIDGVAGARIDAAHAAFRQPRGSCSLTQANEDSVSDVPYSTTCRARGPR